MKLPNLISRILPTKAKQADYHPFRYFPRSDWFATGYAATTLSGEQHRSILLARDPMTSTLITIAIRTIASAIAEVRFIIQDQNGKPMDNHPGQRILDRAEGNWTRSDIAWTIVEGLLIAGNAILIPQPGGRIKAVDWRNVRLPMAGTGHRNYRITDRFTTTIQDYSYEGLSHLRYRRAPDGVNGLGLVAQTALAELATDAQASEYTLAMLANTAAFGNIITPADNDLPDQVQVDDFQESVDGLYTGAGRGQSIVTQRKWNIQQPAGIGQRGADLGPIRNITEERLLSMLGVPPSIVGIGVGMQQTRYGSGLEQQRRQLAGNVIIPLAHHIADQLSAELLPFYPQSEDLRFVPDFTNCIIANELLGYVANQQADYLAKLVAAGIVPPDTARAQLPEHLRG